MSSPDLERALAPVASALEELGVPYRIGGSVASSLHGLARTTLDIDLMADLREAHVESLVERLGTAYYVSRPQISDAIRHRRSFNVIHHETCMKVDIFVPPDRPFEQAVARRVQTEVLAEQSPRAYPFVSAEDIVLIKLRWFQRGGEVSERQWRDVIGVLQVQSTGFDHPYVSAWADQLGVSDLLRRALEQAARDEPAD